MTPTRVRAAAAVLLLVSFSLAATWAKPADSREADTAAINKLFNDFNDSFNNHNAHAVSMLFTDDADFTTIAGATTQGRAGIEQHLAPLYAGRLKTIHREVTVRAIRFLRPDTATVISDYVTTGLTGPNGTAAPAGKGVYDWIVTKQNGSWLITAWHEANLPPPPPPSPAQ
jgi:uncharacterized protein (TIGR02246 family)